MANHRPTGRLAHRRLRLPPRTSPGTRAVSLRGLCGSRHGERPPELHTFEESGRTIDLGAKSSLQTTSPRKADQNVSRSLQNRSLRRTSPVARCRRVGRTRRSRVHAQRRRPAALSTKASASPVPSRSAQLTPSKTASRRKRSTPPTSSSTPTRASLSPSSRRRSSRRSPSSSEGEHVVDVTSPYDPRGPTLSEDGTTAFATVAYDTQKIEAAEFEAADEGHRDRPRRGCPGRVRPGPRLRQG